MDRTLTAGRAAIVSEEGDPRQAAAKLKQAILATPSMMCGSCVRTIEQALLGVTGVSAARASLGQRRVLVTFDPDITGTPDLMAALGRAGFKSAELYDSAPTRGNDRVAALLPRVGVAGFAAANIMLLSVSVWSGSASDMDAPVKALFHWISALIALPAIAYAGQPFFSSALNTLKAGRLNMDVPISLGVILATAMSLFQTMRGTEQVYFDAAIMLVFFLLIGRTLDEQVRARARSAAENLLSLRATTATILAEDNRAKVISARDLAPGQRLLVAAGERLAADGRIIKGASDIDESLISGETVPRAVATGDRVHAGTVNGSGTLEIMTTATDDNTLIAEIGRMMLAAEQNRGKYVRLADRAARYYAPAVHLLGLVTFLGWMFVGAGWETSLTIAVAVLIITCPCALALAVPAVQVAATSRLFRSGVIVKAADGLERLSEIDTVVIDKTGTLTSGALWLRHADEVPPEILAAAASLASASRHPYAQAVAKAARQRGLTIQTTAHVTEVPGCGLTADMPDGEWRLGSHIWATGADGDSGAGDAALWFVRPGQPAFGFAFSDPPRSDARETIRQLLDAGYRVELLSGDRPSAVQRAAGLTGIDAWRGGVRPEEKLHRLQQLKAEGRRVLMIGDGLNDAPALAAAHASLSPATAVDISQSAADAVFQGELLAPVIDTLKTARAAQSLALQNLVLALVYNALFVPLAVLGHVTPLIAAIAMSTSSILVTANALRLNVMTLRLTGPQHRQQNDGERSA